MHSITRIISEYQSQIVVSFLAVLMLFGAFVKEPKIVGDAHEYVLMQEAIMRHGSVDIQLRDLDNVKIIEKNKRPHSFNDVLMSIEKGFKEKQSFVYHFLLSNSGKYYSIHFFSYPLATIPARVILELFGIHPLFSFQVTNVLAVVCVLAYIYFISGFSTYEKHWSVLLFLLSGTTYYLFWIHPEVITASLLYIALISVLDKKYFLSACSAAVASLQNPPIVLFMPFIFLIYFLELKVNKKGGVTQGEGKYFGLLVYLLIAGIIACLPYIFSMYVFGHPNPIMLIHGADFRFVSLSRFVSLWFDLNQGVVLGNAGMYAGIAIAMTLMIFQRLKEIRKSDYIVSLLFVTAAILMTVPTLATGNWNAGSSTFIRYGYWLVMMPIVSFILLTRNLYPRVRFWLLSLVILMQAGIVISNKVWGNSVPPGRFTGISKSIMYHYPGIYNPVPEIFAERSYGAEHSLDENRIYAFEKKGKVTKILINKKNPYAELIRDREMRYRPAVTVNRVDVESGWYYLNGVFTKEPVSSNAIKKRISYDSQTVNWVGWSVPENGFRWSDGNMSAIEFNVDESILSSENMLLNIGPFHEKPQRVKIVMNEKVLFEDLLAEERVLGFSYNPDDFATGKKIMITFHLPDAVRPAAGSDNRRLGIFFKWIEFE